MKVRAPWATSQSSSRGQMELECTVSNATILGTETSSMKSWGAGVMNMMMIKMTKMMTVMKKIMTIMMVMITMTLLLYLVRPAPPHLPEHGPGAPGGHPQIVVTATHSDVHEGEGGS